LYATYDVGGDGKTAIKGGWGRFADWRNGNHVLPLNPNVALQRVYRWRDLNDDRDYDTGEVNLDTSGQDFIQRSAAATSRSPTPSRIRTSRRPGGPVLGLARARLRETSTSGRRVCSRRFDVIRTKNILRPTETYNIANTKPDPGPDGKVGTADDPGTTITWYEYPEALRARTFQLNTLVGDPTATEHFGTVEFAGTKRLSNGWQVLASYSATKSDVPVPAESNMNPNTDINTANNTWEWLFRASSAYVMPWNIMLSANYEHQRRRPGAHGAAHRRQHDS
jgi:hypothetical protein